MNNLWTIRQSPTTSINNCSYVALIAIEGDIKIVNDNFWNFDLVYYIWNPSLLPSNFYNSTINFEWIEIKNINLSKITMPINHPNFNINEQSYVNAYSLVLSNIQGPSNFENIDFKNFVFDIKIDINYQVLNDIQHELEQPYNDWTTIYEKEMNDTKKQMNLTYANHLLLNNENGQFYISENYLIKNSQCYSHSTPTTKIVYTFNDKDENQDIYFPEIIFDQTLEIIGTEWILEYKKNNKQHARYTYLESKHEIKKQIKFDKKNRFDLISNELINHEYDGINGFFLPYTTQAKLSVKVNLISKNNNLRKIVFEKNVSFIQAQNFFDEIVFSTDNDTAKNDIWSINEWFRKYSRDNNYHHGGLRYA